MGCGCSQARGDSLAGRNLRAEQDLALNEHQLYAVAAAPDCTEPYSGPFTSATIYVADRGGPKERFFTRRDWGGAQLYARQNNVTLVHVMATNLCASVMNEFLHGAI